MTILRWMIGIPLVVLAIAFAVANGEIVAFTWSPVNEALNWPLYALVLSAMAIGFIFGSFITWVNGHSLRKERRQLAKKVEAQQEEITKLSAAGRSFDAAPALTDERNMND